LRVQDIIDRLTVLGLDESEAAVYVHLSIAGPSKASDVAAALKLHRTEAYRTLQNLVQRGFVAATLGRPSRFEAAAPEKLFEDILASEKARTENIQRAQTEIAPALISLRGQTAEQFSKNTFRILQGRREIYGVMERMVRGARKNVKALTTHEAAVAMTDLAGILDAAVEKAQEGVQVQGLFRTNPQVRARLAQLPEVPALQLRHLETDKVVRFCLVDEREILFWVVSDPSSRLSSEQEVAVWSDAADLVGSQGYLFDLAWREGKDLGNVSPEGPGNAVRRGPPIA
jgi:sugar-specific transcriptional regulator TrmB